MMPPISGALTSTTQHDFVHTALAVSAETLQCFQACHCGPVEAPCHEHADGRTRKLVFPLASLRARQRGELSLLLPRETGTHQLVGMFD
jgi:hypothetical protein